MSFLLTADAMRNVLDSCGFLEIPWADKTDAAMTWFAEVQSRLGSFPPLRIAVVMGPQFLDWPQNLDQNLQEWRVRLVQAVFIPRVNAEEQQLQQRIASRERVINDGEKLINQ